MSDETYRKIGSVRLRTEHVVYRGADDYRVESKVQSDARRSYGRPVSQSAVRTVTDMLRSGPQTISSISEVLETGRVDRLGFRYRYGYQLYYEVERALLVSVVLKQADVQAAGRGFQFSLPRPAPLP